MRYTFELIARSPLLMSCDDILWAERVKRWVSDPSNRNLAQDKGDDRCPAWTWVGRLYHDGESVAFPSDNLMAALRKAGASVKLGRSSAKSISQSAVYIEAEYLTFTHGGRGDPTPIRPFRGLEGELDFTEHLKLAEKNGFELFMKRVKPAGRTAGRHIRIRPRFSDWRVRGELEVTDPRAMTAELLSTLFHVAGRTVGLGDWRPGAPTPGRYGMFDATVRKAK